MKQRLFLLIAVAISTFAAWATGPTHLLIQYKDGTSVEHALSSRLVLTLSAVDMTIRVNAAASTVAISDTQKMLLITSTAPDQPGEGGGSTTPDQPGEGGGSTTPDQPKPEGPTDVENSEATTNDVQKEVENGQIIIIKNGVRYTLSGTRN